MGAAAEFTLFRGCESSSLGKKKNRINARIIVLVGLLLLSYGSGRVSSLTITVNKVECVTENVMYQGDTVSGNYVVVDHEIFWTVDHPGIDFAVTSPEDKIIETQKGTSGDKFEFKAPKAGAYKFCFHNPTSSPESVAFYIHVGHIPTADDVAKDEHLDPLSIRIAKLSEALESVTTEQKYLKARDAQHRNTNESTRRRIVVFTISEYVALAAISSVQVIFIRRMFSKSFVYNRV